MKRHKYQAAFKPNVALDAVKGEKAVAKIAEVHPNLWTI
jgi:hypothetical protein